MAFVQLPAGCDGPPPAPLLIPCTVWRFNPSARLTLPRHWAPATPIAQICRLSLF